MRTVMPNLITALNLLCGVTGIYLVFTKGVEFAPFFVFLALIFDYLDGALARALNSSSELGKQLDSLADMVTFGVLPGIIVADMLRSNMTWICEEEFCQLVPFIGFIIPIMSAFRLAKFNIDTRQTTSFIGLPTPANAIYFASLPLIVHFDIDSVMLSTTQISSFIDSPIFLITSTLILSYLLVAELPMFSLKSIFKGWGENKLQMIFLAISLVLLILIGIIAIPFIIVLYILLSIAIKTINSSSKLY